MLAAVVAGGEVVERRPSRAENVHQAAAELGDSLAEGIDAQPSLEQRGGSALRRGIPVERKRLRMCQLTVLKDVKWNLEANGDVGWARRSRGRSQGLAGDEGGGATVDV